MNSQSRISSDNVAAVEALIDQTEVLFVPATGKSRVGALRAMAKLGERLQRVHPNGCPGVFLQGLLVFGANGEIIHENKCNAQLTQTVASIAKDANVPLIAYSRDSIVCEKKHDYMDLLPTYHVS